MATPDEEPTQAGESQADDEQNALRRGNSETQRENGDPRQRQGCDFEDPPRTFEHGAGEDGQREAAQSGETEQPEADEERRRATAVAGDSGGRLPAGGENQRR